VELNLPGLSNLATGQAGGNDARLLAFHVSSHGTHANVVVQWWLRQYRQSGSGFEAEVTSRPPHPRLAVEARGSASRR
jgi:hypothetical protein